MGRQSKRHRLTGCIEISHYGMALHSMQSPCTLMPLTEINRNIHRTVRGKAYLGSSGWVAAAAVGAPSPKSERGIIELLYKAPM